MDSGNISSLTTWDEIEQLLREENLTNMIIPGPFEVSTRIVLYFLYGLIMFIALLMNLILVVVILASPKLRTVTNLFLASLGVSDLLIALCNMPFSIIGHIYYSWNLGEPLCKIADYIKAVTVINSIFTLTAIAVDRYFAVCHPLKSRVIHTTKQTVIAIFVFWAFAFLIILPQPFFMRVVTRGIIEGSKYNASLRIVVMCEEVMDDINYPWGRYAYTFSITIVLFVIPLAIISVMYCKVAFKLWARGPVGEVLEDSARYEMHTRKKQKVVLTLVLIVFCFGVCWCPYFMYHVISLYHDFGRDLRVFFQVFGYSNCALNPTIYISLNDTFKASAKDMCHALCPRFKFKGVCFRDRHSNNNGTIVLTNMTSFRTPNSETHSPSHHENTQEGTNLLSSEHC